MPTEEPTPEIDEQEQKQPGFLPKFLLLGLLPSLYAVVLGMVILHFIGIGFHSQVQWLKGHAETLTAKMDQPEEADAVPAAGEVRGEAADAPESETVKDDSTAPPPGNPAGKQGEKGDESRKEVSPPQPANSSSSAPAGRSSPPGPAAGSSSSGPAAVTQATPAGHSLNELYKQMKPNEIAAVLQGIESNSEVLRQIQQMDPGTASKVIAKLDPEVAGWIVTQLN